VSGGIAVVTGDRGGEVDGHSTPYDSFIVWSLPDPIADAATATAISQATVTAKTEAAQQTATAKALIAGRPPSSESQVNAAYDWQSTGIYLLQGETLSVEYSWGTWSPCALTHCVYNDAWGVADGSPDLAPDSSGARSTWTYSDNIIMGCPHGALIGRINDYTFCVGDSYSDTVASEGYLELRINDTAIRDDDGVIEVRVNVR
jgi:hypothetical protein